MCNLYSLTKGQDAIRAFTKAMTDTTGNMPSLPGIFPDQLAPVVHTRKDGKRELSMIRWGFPPPPNLGNRPITNIRNLKSSYWRGWLKPEWRCLVPATAFCEYTDSLPKVPHWFALNEDRPLYAFAGGYTRQRDNPPSGGCSAVTRSAFRGERSFDSRRGRSSPFSPTRRADPDCGAASTASHGPRHSPVALTLAAVRR